jgi:hypothetical protein
LGSRRRLSPAEQWVLPTPASAPNVARQHQGQLAGLFTQRFSDVEDTRSD